MRRLTGRRGIAITEYALLFAAVVLALMTIMTGVGRGVMAKIKGVVVAMTSVTGDPWSGTRPVETWQQYEPYYHSEYRHTLQTRGAHEVENEDGTVDITDITERTRRDGIIGTGADVTKDDKWGRE